MLSIHNTDISIVRPTGHPECENCGSSTCAANFVFKRVSGDGWMQVREVRVICHGADPLEESQTVAAKVVYQRGRIGPCFSCEMDCPAMRNRPLILR